MAGSNRVRLQLGGGLAEIVGAAHCAVELEQGDTLAEVATRAGVSPMLVMLYSVNGTLRPASYTPEPDDEVLLIPAVAGGGH